MKIDVEKFALAVVNSSSPELSALEKLEIYKEAYSVAKEQDEKQKKTTKVKFGI